MWESLPWLEYFSDMLGTPVVSEVEISGKSEPVETREGEEPVDGTPQNNHVPAAPSSKARALKTPLQRDALEAAYKGRPCFGLLCLHSVLSLFLSSVGLIRLISPCSAWGYYQPSWIQHRHLPGSQDSVVLGDFSQGYKSKKAVFAIILQGVAMHPLLSNF